MSRCAVTLWTCRIVAIASMLASLYCLAWTFSSADLGFVACDSQFGSQAANVRCRQPLLAEALVLVFLFASIAAAFTGRKFRK
jgi:hypothetical protein